MLFFLYSIINIVFILFPNLIYIIYVANKQNLKENENKLLFDFSIIVSLFFIIFFNFYFFTNNMIVFLIFLLLFSLLYKRYFSAIIVSIISLEFLKISYNIDYSLFLLLFIGLFILHYLFRNKKNLFIIFYYIYSIISIFLLLSLNEINFYFNFFIDAFILYALLIILKIWIKKIRKILELQNILKEYENEKKIRESLFKITHEIKNPLAVVKGYLSMVNLKNKKKSQSYLKIIGSEVERTINLLQDFMQFSKIEINKSLFNFNTLLEETKDIVSPLLISKNISYVFKSEKNILLNGDYNRLKQVIINVIKNSIEASTNDSKIYITCYINKKSLIIIIKDSGIGMDDETLNSLFTPFYTTKDCGTGLGICLSKEIIEAHKGKIIYYSKLHKGTTAKIVLPLM